ncbi:TRAP transporter small permease [Oceanobacillus bengalensis]|uniref:TRAP transporter small permease n=1 Tax=Oceanobacillus bengalensis TaxID=1435466 RepID=A0A494YTV8_9BACI|nr:TRAP transporter small permease [Oceanobacillus bengalensis]RKQ13573.1 TRAP transporter small permease [Oceanobacillus bengalensis]
MKRFVQALEKLQITVGVLFLTVFFVVILLQIITRYLGISVLWTEEVANYSFIWAIFMGAAVMVNRREHFNFDFIIRKLTGKKKVSLNIFNDLVLIAFNACILVLGIQVVREFWNYTWATIPEMKMGYIWIAIPIMAGTMIIYSVSHLMDHLKANKAKEVSE